MSTSPMRKSMHEMEYSFTLPSPPSAIAVGRFYRSGRGSDRRLRAAGLPNGTRNYPDADRRIMRGYQARAHVGRGSLCVMLFTDWGCDGRRCQLIAADTCSATSSMSWLSPSPGGSQGFRMSYRPE